MIGDFRCRDYLKVPHRGWIRDQQIVGMTYRLDVLRGPSIGKADQIHEPDHTENVKGHALRQDIYIASHHYKIIMPS